MIVLGLDPGGTTGMVLLDDDRMDIITAAAWKPTTVFDALVELMDVSDFGAIERYTITARTVKMSRQMDAVYIIGAALYEARRSSYNIDLQTPADAKNAFPDEKLRDLGMFNMSPHINDATRHALLRSRKMKKRARR